MIKRVGGIYHWRIGRVGGTIHRASRERHAIWLIKHNRRIFNAAMRETQRRYDRETRLRPWCVQPSWRFAGLLLAWFGR